MSGQTLVLSFRNFTRFPDLSEDNIIEKLDLSNNKITDFTGIKSYKLNQLILDNNPKFSSFRGIYDFILPQSNQNDQAVATNSLTHFSCLKTPLGNSPNIMLMAAIIFGDTLKFVNGATIPKSIYKLASSLRSDTMNLILNGWVITSTKPIRILNVESRKRKIIYPQKEQSHILIQNKKVPKTSFNGSVSVYSEADSVISPQTNDTMQESKSNQSPKRAKRKSHADSELITREIKEDAIHEEEEKELTEEERRERDRKEKEENERREQEEKRDKELRISFNAIHDNFLNSIGPIFNNNHEYIVYNTTPGSPSQSRLGRTRSQAGNYSPDYPGYGRSQTQATNRSPSQQNNERTRSQAANYSPSKTQTANSPQNKSNLKKKPSTSETMKILIRKREERNVSVHKDSPFPRNDYFARKKRLQALNEEEEEFYEIYEAQVDLEEEDIANHILEEEMSIHESENEQESQNLVEGENVEENIPENEAIERHVGFEIQPLNEDNENLENHEDLEEINNLQDNENIEENQVHQENENIEQDHNLQDIEGIEENQILQEYEDHIENQNLQGDEDIEGNQELQENEGIEENQELQENEENQEPQENEENQEPQENEENQNLQDDEGIEENQILQEYENHIEDQNLQGDVDIELNDFLQKNVDVDGHEVAQQNEHLELNEPIQENNSVDANENVTDKNNNLNEMDSIEALLNNQISDDDNIDLNGDDESYLNDLLKNLQENGSD